MKRIYYLLIKIAALSLLMIIWIDEVYRITNSSFFTYPFECIKIIFNSGLAYLLVKYITKKLKNKAALKTVKPVKIFLVFFLTLNSYLIFQYSTRLVSNRILNVETRSSLASKLKNTDFIGFGYRGQRLTFEEYTEIEKYTNLPEIPDLSKDIAIFDWYGFQDYTRVVAFSVSNQFNIKQFYNNDESVLEDISEETEETELKIDTLTTKRYKWAVGGI